MLFFYRFSFWTDNIAATWQYMSGKRDKKISQDQHITDCFTLFCEFRPINLNSLILESIYIKYLQIPNSSF